MSERRIAFLRAVNLGPHKRIAMGELRALLERLGHEGVATYLQSGNVVVTSDLEPGGLAAELERQIADGLGVECEVIVRTRDELAGIVARDPLGKVADDPARYLVTFLGGEPADGAVEAAAKLARGGERLVREGRELYSWHPDGIGRSKLAPALATPKLQVPATARNWRTVTKLL